jgi:hypothetical protein
MSDNEWYYVEGIPGSGPRPDYLESKYKSIADQAKAYKEARSELGRLHGSVPEQYDVSDHQDWIDPTNPHLKGFLDFAKDKKLSQEVVSKAMGTLVEYEKSMMPDTTLDAESQKKMGIVENWAKNTFSPEGIRAFEILPKTKEIVGMLDEMRQKEYANRSKAPTSMDHASSFKVQTEAEIRTEMREQGAKYINDSAYRADVARRLAQVLGEG